MQIPITTDEQLEEALTWLADNTETDPACPLSEAINDYWSGGNRWLKQAGEKPASLCVSMDAETPEDFDPSEYESAFLKEIGFNHPFSEPAHFSWGGNGDVYWLIEWGTGNLKSDLETWCADRHREAIESAEYAQEHLQDCIHDITADAEERGKSIDPYQAARMADHHIAYEKGGPL